MKRIVMFVFLMWCLTGCVSVEASEPYDPVGDVEAQRIEAIKQAKRVGVTIITEGSGGSGIVIDSDADGYYILTAEHVIGIGRVYHDTSGGLYDYRIVGRDAMYDLAVLYVETADVLPVYDLDRYTMPTIGQEVFAIGNPMGKFNYVVSGIVTYTDTGYRLLNNVAFMHDAYVTEGFSGGGLFNLRGDLVGINVAKLDHNMALALNLNAIRDVVQCLRQSDE
jgi:serine protease Do